MSRSKKQTEAPNLGLHVADRDPTKPARWELADALAFRALAAGNANDQQQKRALQWFVRGAADAYGLSFRAGDPHATAFAEGRRFAGLQVIKLVELSPAAMAVIRQKEDDAAKAAKIAELKRQKVMKR